MFKGIVGSESLKKPLVLNKFKPLKVLIERDPDSSLSPFWHMYFFALEERDLQIIVKALSATIKYGCYAIFWNKKTIILVLENKIFTLPKDGWSKSREFKDLKLYGSSRGIKEKYLQLNKEFDKYKKCVRK